MSPLPVRRYRAERLLRGEFLALRANVLRTVRARLRGAGIALDASDLEGCYLQAWQGLYTAVLEGQEIANPAGWLVLVTFRRAVEESRSRARASRAGGGGGGGGDGAGSYARADADGEEVERAQARERDIDAQLDDRASLRQLFEGLRGRLDAREREAAVLCYLQGLSRAQAAARMGVSEARMRKLMEGRGAGSPGVAGKMGALVATIREGAWCEQQGSLMRALAYGILDPDGERYELALLHHAQCPACRAYVSSLRGIAAALPPVLAPWGIGAAALARAGGAHTAGAGAAAGGAMGAGTRAAGGIGGASGTAGAGAGAAGAGLGVGGMTGGGWLFAGGAKLAAGCVLALSVGAGCVALSVGVHHRHTPPRARALTARVHGAGAPADGRALVGASLLAPGPAAQGGAAGAGGAAVARASSAGALTPAGRASREFGPEQALAGGGSGARVVQAAPAGGAGARVASTRAVSAGGGGSSTRAGGGGGGGEGSAQSATPLVRSSAGSGSSSGGGGGGVSRAEREFSPG